MNTNKQKIACLDKILSTFEDQFIKQLSKTKAELPKWVAYEERVFIQKEAVFYGIM